MVLQKIKQALHEKSDLVVAVASSSTSTNSLSLSSKSGCTDNKKVVVDDMIKVVMEEEGEEGEEGGFL